MSYQTYCYICGGPTCRGMNRWIPKSINKMKYLLKKKYKSGSKYFRNIDYSYYDNIVYELEHIFRYSYNPFVLNAISSIKNKKLEVSKIDRYKWLYDLVFLPKDSDKVIKVSPKDTWKRIYMTQNHDTLIAGFPFYKWNLTDYEDSIHLRNKLKMYDPQSSRFVGDGYVMHNSCYKLIKSRIGEFYFSDLHLAKINYGAITNYMTQEVCYNKFIFNDEEYMLEDPLTNEKNRKRIFNIILPINITDEGATLGM